MTRTTRWGFWTFFLGATTALAACGSDDECSGAACDASGSGGAGSGGTGGTGGSLTCNPAINGCVDDMNCPDPASVSLGLREEASIATDPDANPEIVGFIPGSSDRALVISAQANQLVELKYTISTLEFGRKVTLATGSDTSIATSVKPAPDGQMAAVTVAEADCGIGSVLFVDISDSDAFGNVLGRVDVGYNPDSGAFSKDGKYFVTADEDDREDRPCKPDTRLGGSVSIIDVAGGPGSATVVQTLAVDHAMDSEPEGVAVGPDGRVVVTIQETSELGLFSLDDVPDATLTLVPLEAESEPDGVAVSSDGRWAAVTLERLDTLVIYDLANDQIASSYVIARSGDVPDDFNRDEGKVTKDHEPEQVDFIWSRGELYAVIALQESHAAIAYAVDGSGSVSFDSIARVGIGWEAEASGREKSEIGTEGLATNSDLGVVLTANEREGSITLVSTQAGRDGVCN